MRSPDPREVSRRTFLGMAAGALASVLPPKTVEAPIEGVAAGGGTYVDCVLLDSSSCCALPESLAGYESALRAAGARFLRTDGPSVPHSKVLIIPACVAPRSGTAAAVATTLKKGGCVVVESGGGFAASRDFSLHQRWLREQWGLDVGRPINLWESLDGPIEHPGPCPRHGACHSRFAYVTPYVDLYWPSRTTVRDFSRIVPVSAPAEQVVGWCGGKPVACKQILRRGTLVYLGTPLGPALWVGDAEARRWLREVVATKAGISTPRHL